RHTAALILFALGLASLAQASDVYTATFSVVVTNNTGGFIICDSGQPCATGPTMASVSLMSGPSDETPYTGSGSAGPDGSTDPGVGAIVSVAAAQLPEDSPPFDNFSYTAGAGLAYYFELTQTGGTYSGAVPVGLTGSMSLSTQVNGTLDYTTSSSSILIGTV